MHDERIPELLTEVLQRLESVAEQQREFTELVQRLTLTANGLVGNEREIVEKQGKLTLTIERLVNTIGKMADIQERQTILIEEINKKMNSRFESITQTTNGLNEKLGGEMSQMAGMVLLMEGRITELERKGSRGKTSRKKVE